jgi:PE family
MSFLMTEPQLLIAAASDLQAIGSDLSARTAAAAAPTIGLVPAGVDAVSALTATQFAAYAQIYQAVSAQAAAVNDMLVAALTASADAYADSEAANATFARL